LQVDTDVSEEHAACIFMVEEMCPSFAVHLDFTLPNPEDNSVSHFIDMTRARTLVRL
jgi:hypothetical protein